MCASPAYERRKIPLNWSVVSSPISRTSSSGGCKARRCEWQKGGLPTATDLGAHGQLDDLDLVCDDTRFVAFVESGIEELCSVRLELIGEARPVELEAGKGWVKMDNSESEGCVAHLMMSLSG